jgi:small conductance mechanosensitive channel
MDTFAEALAALIGRLAGIEGPLLVLVSRVLVVLAAVALALLSYRATARVVDRLLRPLEGASDYPAKVQRARTLGPLMKSVARYALAFMAVVVTLREVGVDIRALLVSAGVLGLAVGLGAQSLIKDVITGFFILFEGLVAVGDVIEVGPHTGTVEAIGLRVTKLRMLNGAQRIIPNGELTQFTNYNKGWARAVLDIAVAWDADVRRALRALEQAARQWGEETGLALEEPQAQGIVRFGEGELGLRLMVKVPAERRADIEMELRRRIKEALEAEGIRLPAAERVVYMRAERPGRDQ